MGRRTGLARTRCLKGLISILEDIQE